MAKADSATENQVQTKSLPPGSIPAKHGGYLTPQKAGQPSHSKGWGEKARLRSEIRKKAAAALGDLIAQAKDKYASADPDDHTAAMLALNEIMYTPAQKNQKGSAQVGMQNEDGSKVAVQVNF